MVDYANTLSERLLAAAAILSGKAGTPGAADLIRYLGYGDDDEDAAGGARLLRAAAGFVRLFRLPIPDAPGLVFFGAEADPARLGAWNAGLPVSGFAGSGLDARRAFEACVGEGVEWLSQFWQPGDLVKTGGLGDFGDGLDPDSYRFVGAVFAACGVGAAGWVPVRRLADGAASWFPADLCLRRAGADFVAPLKLSTGCGAGVSTAAAARHGLLELIERDAVALWWRGGRRGRAIPPGSAAGLAAAALLGQVRGGGSGRVTSLLYVTTDLGVPVAVAFSVRGDGSGLALGMSSRESLAEAARSAIFEMCQSELSLHVIAAKRRQSGEAALNDSDRRQLARAGMDVEGCGLLRAVGEADGDAVVDGIEDRLAERGIVTYTLDLTRERFGVPVVRVIAPGLQLEPCSVVGPRLAAAMAETGGGAALSGGIALL